jgi:Rrf2 family cysteine metabolism transcriptional repressor
MASRRTAAPLRVTERADYALKSVLLLSLNEGDFLTAKTVADHYVMSQKMLASVLWNLRAAGILDSRPGWHGGFRLARPAQAITVSSVIAASENSDDGELTRPIPVPIDLSDPDFTQKAGHLVEDFWHALDEHVQGILAAFTVADLARARALT